jgi:nucleoid-associated protein YgaU
MNLTQAVIEVEAQSVNESRGLRRTFQVQFNPTEYTLNKAAQIAEIAIPGIDSPILQFIRGQNEKLTLDLFFDTTRERGMGANARNVRELTGPIYQLVKIQPKTHAPPRITFSWGQGLSFKAIVESVQQKFTLFNPEGIPLRATLSVTFREYKTLEQQISEMNLQSSDHTKSYVVQRNDTLSAIAYQEYRDAEAWRHIADANRDVIINPRRLMPGTVLDIPPLDVFGTPIVRRP